MVSMRPADFLKKREKIGGKAVSCRSVTSVAARRSGGLTGCGTRAGESGQFPVVGCLTSFKAAVRFLSDGLAEDAPLRDAERVLAGNAFEQRDRRKIGEVAVRARAALI